jgi:hypothetical protein
MFVSYRTRKQNASLYFPAGQQQHHERREHKKPERTMDGWLAKGGLAGLGRGNGATGSRFWHGSAKQHRQGVRCRERGRLIADMCPAPSLTQTRLAIASFRA